MMLITTSNSIRLKAEIFLLRNEFTLHSKPEHGQSCSRKQLNYSKTGPQHSTLNFEPYNPITMKLSTLAAFPMLSLALAAAAPDQSLNLNTLSPAERRDGWTLLFDGKSFAGWQSYQPVGATVTGWKIEDGCMKNTKAGHPPGGGGGDILTDEKFSDFDFQFEWRIAPGGNSGVKYFVRERQTHPGAKMWTSEDGTTAVGHEYQLMDDTSAGAGENNPVDLTGALYLLVAPNANKQLKPVGEFNLSGILVQGDHVEHWLNGAKILEYECGSPALAQAVAKTKFKDIPVYGTKFPSRLLLQDHGAEVWFRNLKIRRL